MFEKRLTRRKFIRKAAYASPFILSLPAALSFASEGSPVSGTWHKHRKKSWEFLWWEGHRTKVHFHPDEDS